MCILMMARYYVDLDSIPPRATLVHPADGVSQGHDQSRRTSISSRPSPTINTALTGNSPNNVQIHGTATTSAQRLYATGMTSNSSHLTSISPPTARSIVDRDATPADIPPPPTQASRPSPPLPPTSVSESEHFQFRYRPRRLREKHQPTHPFSSLPLSEGSTGQTLYNAAVQTSASVPSTSDSFKPRGPRMTRNASLRSSYAEGPERRRKALPPIPAANGERRNSMITISTTPHSQHTNLYSGITEDNVFLIPAHGKVLSTEQRAILIDEVPLSPISPNQSGLQQASSPFTGTRSTDQVILQPRPIKPLQGLTASFQDQIRLTSQPRTESLEEEQLKKDDVSTAKQMPLFRRFTTAGFRRPIREDNCRPSDEDSSWTQILDSSLDESFVVVDHTHF